MRIRLDGDSEPLGWVTGVAKDETENVRLAAMGFPLMRVLRSLPVRDGKELEALRVGEVPANSLVRVMDTHVMEDKTEKVAVCAPRITRALAPVCPCLAHTPPLVHTHTSTGCSEFHTSSRVHPQATEPHTPKFIPSPPLLPPTGPREP